MASILDSREQNLNASNAAEQNDRYLPLNLSIDNQEGEGHIYWHKAKRQLVLVARDVIIEGDHTNKIELYKK